VSLQDKSKYHAPNVDSFLDAVHRGCLQQDLAIPPIILIDHDDESGRTGSTSTQADAFAVFSVGPRKSKLGVIISADVDRDGVDSDGSDYDQENGNDRRKKSKPEISFNIKASEFPEENMEELWMDGSSAYDNQPLRNGIYSGSNEFCSFHVDVPPCRLSAGATQKYNRAACNTFIQSSGCPLDFDAVLSMALRQLAAKMKWLQFLRKALSRRRDMPPILGQLVDAFQALPAKTLAVHKAKAKVSAATARAHAKSLVAATPKAKAKARAKSKADRTKKNVVGKKVKGK
jgi:hypothetical protein